LKALLLDGAEQGAAGHAVIATNLYREAQGLCAGEGLVLEEALVLIALGGMCLGAGVLDTAVASYRQSAALARTKQAWGVVCQAWLGAGGADFTREHHEPAALSYRAAAEAAQLGEIAVLGVEARRLEGTCWRLSGAEENAIRAWQNGLDTGAELRGSERGASTLPAVATAFSDLLERHGLNEQAAHVRVVATRSSAGEDVPPPPTAVGDETLSIPSALPSAELPFINRSVDPFLLGPSAPSSHDTDGETVELRVHAAGRTVAFAGSSGDAPPGKRLIRFDPQTGKALPAPSWAELPAMPVDETESARRPK
jgi:hypothetical protein